MLELGYDGFWSGAMAPDHKVVPLGCSNPKIRSSTATSKFSLLSFSLNDKTSELAKSTKLARTVNTEDISAPAVVSTYPPVEDTVFRRCQRQRRAGPTPSWGSKVLGDPQILDVSSEPRSLACSRRTNCCSTGYGCAFQVLSESDLSTAARELKCVRKKQALLLRGVHNINSSSSSICVRSSDQRGFIDFSASPALGGSKSGVEHPTSLHNGSFTQPLLELTKALSTLLLKSRLSNQESSFEIPNSSKIPTQNLKEETPQAVRPEKPRVSPSPFFGHPGTPISSRSSTPELEATKVLPIEKVHPSSVSNSTQTAAVKSLPDGGREGNTSAPGQGDCQGDQVLLHFLCPERPDIAYAQTADTLIAIPIPREPGGYDELSESEEFPDTPIEEEGRSSTGNQEGEGGGSSGATHGGEGNGVSPQTSAAPHSGTAVPGGVGPQNGSSGGNGGDDENRKPAANSHAMDVDVIVKQEIENGDEMQIDNEISQDEKDKLTSIANEAIQQPSSVIQQPSSAAASGLLALRESISGPRTHAHPQHHASPQALLSNGSSHSSPGQGQPVISTDKMPLLPVISESPHQAPSPNAKPTLPSLSSAIPQLQQLADLAIQQQQGYASTSQSGPFSPAQSVVSIATSQRSSDTPQPPPISPPAPAKTQAGYGSDSSHTRKPIHHMTVQEQANFVHPPPASYYPSMPYQYPHLNDDMRSSGPTTNIQAPQYPPVTQHPFQQGRELPSLYQTTPTYHYPHETAPAEPQPLRTGATANLFAQQPYEEQHTPSGPPTADSMPSVAGSDDTIAAPISTPKRSGSHRVDGALPPGTFRCEHPGCTAPPFQTQYLLNSHANVHSVIRPHFCPVPGCPRGEKGRGFKRKNEMIRHGLVHESPGYVCPFCPDREHKYPRPDNLQRHVRVHHQDKNRDDPQLREVLSQRPEGGNRGRRRRAG